MADCRMVFAVTKTNTQPRSKTYEDLLNSARKRLKPHEEMGEGREGGQHFTEEDTGPAD